MCAREKYNVTLQTGHSKIGTELGWRNSHKKEGQFLFGSIYFMIINVRAKRRFHESSWKLAEGSD